jgi:hypothetical protein
MSSGNIIFLSICLLQGANFIQTVYYWKFLRKFAPEVNH